jgi:hypothetical protein
MTDFSPQRPSMNLRLFKTGIHAGVCLFLLSNFTAHAQAVHTVMAPLPLDLNAVFVKPIGAQGFVFTPQWLGAHDKTVAIQGFMVQQELAPEGRFLFAQRPVQMSEHADGEADDLPASVVMVVMPKNYENAVALYQRGLINLSGQLKVGRFEASDGRVVWLRLLLNDDALRTLSQTELAALNTQHTH